MASGENPESVEAPQVMDFHDTVIAGIVQFAQMQIHKNFEFNVNQPWELS